MRLGIVALVVLGALVFAWPTLAVPTPGATPAACGVAGIWVRGVCFDCSPISDGVCPASPQYGTDPNLCTAAGICDPDCGACPVCGNSAVEMGEQCDGGNVGPVSYTHLTLPTNREV